MPVVSANEMLTELMQTELMTPPGALAISRMSAPFARFWKLTLDIRNCVLAHAPLPGNVNHGSGVNAALTLSYCAVSC